MTVSDITTHALGLLGYAGERPVDERVSAAIYNLVAADLSKVTGTDIPTVSGAGDTVAPGEALDAVIAGVAAFTALAAGDMVQHGIYEKEYRARRAGFSRVERVRDVLPGRAM